MLYGNRFLSHKQQLISQLEKHTTCLAYLHNTSQHRYNVQFYQTANFTLKTCSTKSFPRLNVSQIEGNKYMALYSRKCGNKI